MLYILGIWNRIYISFIIVEFSFHAEKKKFIVWRYFSLTAWAEMYGCGQNGQQAIGQIVLQFILEMKTAAPKYETSEEDSEGSGSGATEGKSMSAVCLHHLLFIF